MYPEATPILRAAVPPRRLLSNISTTRQASTQVPRVPPQAQRVGEWGKDPHDFQLGPRCGGKGAYCELRSPLRMDWFVGLFVEESDGVMELEQCL